MVNIYIPPGGIFFSGVYKYFFKRQISQEAFGTWNDFFITENSFLGNAIPIHEFQTHLVCRLNFQKSDKLYLGLNHFYIWLTMTFLEILYIFSKITLRKIVVATMVQPSLLEVWQPTIAIQRSSTVVWQLLAVVVAAAVW